MPADERGRADNENISTFQYPGARPLYIYVKTPSRRDPRAAEFVGEWAKSWGSDGPLTAIVVANPRCRDPQRSRSYRLRSARRVRTEVGASGAMPTAFLLRGPSGSAWPDGCRRARARGASAALRRARLAALPAYHALYVACGSRCRCCCSPSVERGRATPDRSGGAGVACRSGFAAVRLPARNIPAKRARGDRSRSGVLIGSERPRRAVSGGDRRSTLGFAAALVIAFLGVRGRSSGSSGFAARSSVERAVMALRLLASLSRSSPRWDFASLVFETVRFFGMVVRSISFSVPTGDPTPMSSAEARTLALRRVAAVLGDDLHRRDHRHARCHPARN